MRFEARFRGIPIVRFIELAAFYGVPATVLLP